MQGFVRKLIRILDFRATRFFESIEPIERSIFESLENDRIDPVLLPHGFQTTYIDNTYPNTKLRANMDADFRFSSHSIFRVDRALDFSSRSKSIESSGFVSGWLQY